MQSSKKEELHLVSDSELKTLSYPKHNLWENRIGEKKFMDLKTQMKQDLDYNDNKFGLFFGPIANDLAFGNSYF